MILVAVWSILFSLFANMLKPRRAPFQFDDLYARCCAPPQSMCTSTADSALSSAGKPAVRWRSRVAMWRDPPHCHEHFSITTKVMSSVCGLPSVNSSTA